MSLCLGCDDVETRTNGRLVMAVGVFSEPIPMMDTAYLEAHRWMGSPFVWSEDDCMVALVNYLVRLGYPDVAAQYRGTYDSAYTCNRIFKFLSDPVKPLADVVAEIPLDKTETPLRGDIGVIQVSGQRPTGALYLGKNWAIRGERAVHIGPAKHILAAWSVNRARQ